LPLPSTTTLFPYTTLFRSQKYRDEKPEEEIYRNWIQMYASDWFQESTQEMIELIDDLAAKASDDEKEKIIEQFVIAKEYELAFWEMSYTFETWLSEK